MDKSRSPEIIEITRNLKAQGLEHRVLSGSDIRQQFPPIQADDTCEAVYEPQGAVLRADRCLAALLVVYSGIIRIPRHISEHNYSEACLPIYLHRGIAIY